MHCFHGDLKVFPCHVLVKFCNIVWRGHFQSTLREILSWEGTGPAGVSEIRLYILQYAVQFGAIPRFHTRKYILDYSL